MDKKTSKSASPRSGGAKVAGAAGAPSKQKPATEFNPSGAPQQVVGDVDPSHPAVDANPREGTTAEQNRIDFNDPTKPGHEAVADNLKQQG